MKERRFVVDCFTSSDNSEVFVISEVPLVPGALPKFVDVCKGSDSLSKFFIGLEKD